MAKFEMKKIITILAIVFTLVVGVVIYAGFNGDKNLDENKSNDEETIHVENKKVLSCYEAINNLLEKDGFEYIDGTRWGRGEKNFFSFDVVEKKFHVGAYEFLNVMEDNWFDTEYNKFIGYTYSYDDKTLIHQQSIINGNIYNLKEDDYTMYPEELNNTENFYYEIPLWMEYYVDQFDKMGYSNVQNLDSLKSTTSNYRESNLVSVFDVKSNDGTIKYFGDVHQPGKVQDHPRYIELDSFEEFLALKSEESYEQFFSINIINQDKTKVFESDSDLLQASDIEEFVKDVVFQFTPARNDKKAVETVGVYFINVDNPNGEFKRLYKEPFGGSPYNSDITDDWSDIRELSIPYEGTIVEANKDDTEGYRYYQLSITELEHCLRESLKNVVFFNPNAKFTDDFIRNYTRPFAYDWQMRMGLTELFDEKYGLIDHVIQYVN